MVSDCSSKNLITHMIMIHYDSQDAIYVAGSCHPISHENFSLKSVPKFRQDAMRPMVAGKSMLLYWYPVRVYLKIEYSQDHHLNQLKIIILTLKYAIFGGIPVYRCTPFLHSAPFCGSNKTSPSVDVRKWRPPERKISWDTQMPQVTGYHFLRLI